MFLEGLLLFGVMAGRNYRLLSSLIEPAFEKVTCSKVVSFSCDYKHVGKKSRVYVTTSGRRSKKLSRLNSD